MTCAHLPCLTPKHKDLELKLPIQQLWLADVNPNNSNNMDFFFLFFFWFVCFLNQAWFFAFQYFSVHFSPELLKTSSGRINIGH